MTAKTKIRGFRSGTTYDGVYRLTAETITDPAAGNTATTYIYDAAGNRLSKTDGAGTTTYAYDTNDRLITESGPGASYVYSYDANGNTTAKTGNGETITYAYDFENRLLGLDTPASQIQYAYDPDGIRVSQTVDGTQTQFVVDKNRDYAQVLEERDSLNALTASYIYGDDLISQERAGIDSFYHYDGLGSTRVLSDAAGAATDTYTYEAFGGMTTAIGITQNNYKFTGEQYDPNAGFYYLRARYYNPGVGRFVTRDTWEGNIFDQLSLNKYLYVKANPIFYIDPIGLIFLSELQFRQAIEGMLRRNQNAAYKLTVQYKKGAIKCILVEEISSALIDQGIYFFIDKVGLPYVGKTINFDRRLSEHLRGKLQNLAKVGGLLGVEPKQQKIIEQWILDLIQDLQGRKQGELKGVSNRRNAAGVTLRKLLKNVGVCK